jgi:hypothetical protein
VVEEAVLIQAVVVEEAVSFIKLITHSLQAPIFLLELVWVVPQQATAINLTLAQ